MIYGRITDIYFIYNTILLLPAVYRSIRRNILQSVGTTREVVVRLVSFTL